MIDFVRSRRTFSGLAIAFGIALVLQACGGQNNGSASDLTVLSASATSMTSIEVTFSGPVGSGSTDPVNYVVTDPTGARLGIVAAYPNDGGSTVSLATEPQKQVTYVLSVRNIRAATGGGSVSEVQTAGAFGGSGEHAPIVASAIALSNTQVLITFANPTNGHAAPMGQGAEVPEYYEIANPSLDVVAAKASSDKTTVVLTTSSQENIPYLVKVTNVFARNGKKLVDPFNSTVAFNGIPTFDQTPPRVTTVTATSNTTLLVSFSEPVSDEAADPSRYLIVDGSGKVLVVTAAVLNEFNTQVTLTTLPQVEGAEYILTITGIQDKAGNPIDASVPGSTFTGVSKLGPPEGDITPPRVNNAGSTANNSVIVTFSEPVLGGPSSAELASHYRITSVLGSAGSIDTQATLSVTGAMLSPDRTSVELTTGSQSDIRYTVEVTNVRDLAGNQIAPPQLGVSNPSSATFVGTPPGPNDLADGDGDGLTDDQEMRGWVVTITNADGTTTQREVSSDPGYPDTDSDGVSDREENIYGTDPRTSDSDGDDLTDFQELNHTYSDPTMKDSDGDGLTDGLEFNFFKTSPISADSDGDQFPDDYEVTSGNRNALIADLPRIKIGVGGVNLSLDERFTFTDTEGETQEVTSSSSTTLEQGNDRTYSTSDTNTLSSSLDFNQSLTVGGEFEFPKTGKVTAEATVGSAQSQAEEYTSNVSQESAQRSNRIYNESVAKSSGFQSTSEVIRSIDDASVQVALELGGISSVAFSATNLEITAMWQDPIDPTRLVPIASLIPAAQVSTGNVPVYNLGPFVPTIGPIVFENREIFPKTVEDLLRSPRGLVFKVANYDIQDESGRNFAFSSQDTYDATVGIVVDYGNGNVKRERVSTIAGRIAPFDDTDDDEITAKTCDRGDSCDNNGDGVVDDSDRIIFNADGNMVGTTMKDALALLGIPYEVQDVDFDGVDGVEVLFSVGSGAAKISTNAAEHKAWILFVSNRADAGIGEGQELGEVNFEDLILGSGETYTLAYLQDKDEDGLFAREEFVHGSSDDFSNSDHAGGSNSLTCPTEGYAFDWFQANAGQTLPLERPAYTCDTIGDFEEVKSGWLVRVRGETEYQGFSSPRLPDSDGDGLADHLEKELGTDAFKRDTDGDGISDFDEVYGFKIRFRGALAFSDFTTKFCAAKRTNADATCSSPEDYVTDPLDPDTDGDGIQDGFEIGLGANPQFADAADFIDTDQDGLSDSKEDEIGSSKYEPDTDGDGLPDLLEYMIGSNPVVADSDGDGLSDYQELDIDTFNTIDSDFNVDDFRRICGSFTYNATSCSYAPPTGTGLPYGTDPTSDDTDGDDLTDPEELFGSWTVSVFGQADIQVTSDPLQANADNDGWNDKREKDEGTDPNDNDTDGDTFKDNEEASLCIGTVCQDPLRPDQLVTLKYSIAGVRGGASSLICGETKGAINGGKGHFIGTLYYTLNGTRASNPFDVYVLTDYVQVWKATGIYRGGNISVAGNNLQRVTGVDGVRYDMTEVTTTNVITEPDFKPIPYTPWTKRVQQVNIEADVCAFDLKFEIIPFENTP